MKYQRSAVILIVLLFNFLGCKKEKASQVPSFTTKLQSKPDTTMVAVKPVMDSTLTLTQIKVWLSCGPLLDSLTFRYADSFKVKDVAEHQRYQKDFQRMQNIICKERGLAGGYEEYEWILKNAGASRNKALFDSLRANPDF